jgi:ABC-type sugar transport system permease subunit
VNGGLVALGRVLHSDWLLAFDGYPWLAPDHLYIALLPIYIWMACGFNLILYLAAMESIDPQLYEAAELEGASAWRQFFTITLPLIRDAILISAVFLVIAGLNAFEMIWLLTSQEPTTASHTLGTLLVVTMFKSLEIGRAAALAVILFLLVAAGSIGVWRALKQRGGRDLAGMKRERFQLSRWLVFATLAGYAAWVVFPMIWVAYSSLKADSAIFRDTFAPPALDSLHVDNYAQAWTEARLKDYFLNSVIVTAASVTAIVALGAMAAYALARFSHPLGPLGLLALPGGPDDPRAAGGRPPLL